MQKWFVVLFLLAVVIFPFSAQAQSTVRISSLQVELWPEYDQPSMLVINYITLSPATTLPATLVFRMPVTAGKPSALAVGQTPDAVSDQGIEYTVVTRGDYLEVTIKANGPAIQLEYYDPLQKNGTKREYVYKWLTDYQIDSFALTLQQPVGATDLAVSPALSSSATRIDNLTYFSKDFGALAPGDSVSLSITYEKPNDALSVSSLKVQPSQPLGADTSGRVMLSNYLPYILGGIGAVLIVGGFFYFWQSSRGRKWASRRRHATPTEDANSNVYCHQCGTRAQTGDRFCRVCGTKLRAGE